jgi:hypothetical protein
VSEGDIIDQGWRVLRTKRTRRREWENGRERREKKAFTDRKRMRKERRVAMFNWKGVEREERKPRRRERGVDPGTVIIDRYECCTDACWGWRVSMRVWCWDQSKVKRDDSSEKAGRGKEARRNAAGEVLGIYKKEEWMKGRKREQEGKKQQRQKGKKTEDKKKEDALTHHSRVILSQGPRFSIPRAAAACAI